MPHMHAFISGTYIFACHMNFVFKASMNFPRPNIHTQSTKFCVRTYMWNFLICCNHFYKGFYIKVFEDEPQTKLCQTLSNKCVQYWKTLFTMPACKLAFTVIPRVPFESPFAIQIAM